jgi:CopA family copper-resistance protein
LSYLYFGKGAKMKSFLMFFCVSLFVALVLLLPINSFSKTIQYDLAIEKKPITIHGKTSLGMTINGSIPGPVLKFREGDFASIKVHNKMDVNTSIHWHGLLVPPDMDGVPYISFPPIEPGKTFTYEFPIRQSGTYWYHSHTHLQEQRGLYGSIVIEPRKQGITVDQDHVVLLSDWTTENPDIVLKTLKSGSEWYSLQKGSSQSILGAAKQKGMGSYFKRELQRMPPMDIADVAYDYFLANGKQQSSINARVNEKIRLRIINGSATTYFYLEFSGSPMQIISADGQDVHPVSQKRFLIGVAETYDVIVSIPGPGSYELRATAHDGSGHASVWVGSGRQMAAPDIPNPNLYKGMEHGGMNTIFALTPQGTMGMPDHMVENGYFDAPGMAGMDHSMDMKDMNDQTHSQMKAQESLHQMEKPHKKDQMDNVHKMDGMDMGNKSFSMGKAIQNGKSHTYDYGLLSTDVSSLKRVASDGISPERPWPPYQKLRSRKITSFNKDKTVKELRLTLDGDMERYVWFLNKKPLSESDSILIKEGQIVRFIMINRTMMHHPMHLHGHFFRVINGQRDHSPLKHTVSVAPMSTTVIEFNANESGDWFFHCHLLYHMKGGMARKLHYQNFTPSQEVEKISKNLFKDSWYFWGQVDTLSHMSEGSIKFANTRNTIEFEWETGWQEVDDLHWEGTLTLDRYINRFFSVFVGGIMEGEDSQEEETNGILGIGYLLPLNIEFQSWVDTEGEARFDLKKEFDLTLRISLETEVQYDTEDDWESSVGLSYLLHKNISLTLKWHSEYQLGAGLTVRF